MLRKNRLDQTVVGHGTAIEGTLKAEGSVHIDGMIHGGVEGADVVSVGPDGAVHGEVNAASQVVVGGAVEGIVRVAGLLRVRAGGRVSGEAHYLSLEVEKGGLLQGTSHQLDTAEPARAQLEPVAPLRRLEPSREGKQDQRDGNASEEPARASSLQAAAIAAGESR